MTHCAKLKGMVPTPEFPASLEAMDKAIVSGATRKNRTHRPDPPHRTRARRNLYAAKRRREDALHRTRTRRSP